MSKKITPKFRVSFPYVFKPQVNKLSNKEEYTVMALFPKGTDLSALKTAASEALKEKWGSDQNKWPANLRSPFRDQKELKNDGVMPPGTEEGAIFMRFKSKQKPGVVDANVQPILDPKEFYAGCWAICDFSCYAYDQAGNRGVAFGLNNIQKVADDKPIGTSVSKPEDVFAPITSSNNTSDGATSLFE